MTIPVGLTDRAEEEWDSAYKWWAKNRSAEQAARWYNGMADAIEGLADQPNQWPLARENTQTPFELRERHFGLGSKPTHRILFTVRPEIILVLSIRHVAQQEFSMD